MVPANHVHVERPHIGGLSAGPGANSAKIHQPSLTLLAPAGLCRVGHAVLGQEMADVHPGGTLVVDDQALMWR